MKQKLNLISEKFNLWNIAEFNAMKCIENYLTESIEIEYPILLKVIKNDFEITKDSQSLIFWSNGNQTYIIRTKLNIQLPNTELNINGYYLYDVNENGEFVDEWFVLN